MIRMPREEDATGRVLHAPTRIRMEAPGSGFVDSHDRRSYVRHVTLSEGIRGLLKAFDGRIKTEAVAKLKDVMGSEPWLKGER
jgi:hypothetical protein